MSHGKYSQTCRNTLERSLRHQKGPISNRTRSQARQPTSTSYPPSQPTPATGHFPPTRQTRTAQAHAEHKLRRSRLKLQRFLQSSRWQDIEDVDGREPTREQIEQLGRLDAVGGILSIPRARPGRWDSELRMISRRARRKRRPSALREVEYNYTERELDELFGVLPGEAKGDADEDEDAEVYVVEQLTEEGRVEEALWDGEEVGGVWRCVGGSGNGEDVAAVARWAFDCGVAWEWRVMDPYCVSVVRKVLNLKKG